MKFLHLFFLLDRTGIRCLWLECVRTSCPQAERVTAPPVLGAWAAVLTARWVYFWAGPPPAPLQWASKTSACEHLPSFPSKTVQAVLE